MIVRETMHKRFDDIFSALMLAAAVAVVLAGWWVLMRSIGILTRSETRFLSSWKFLDQ